MPLFWRNQPTGPTETGFCCLHYLVCSKQTIYHDQGIWLHSSQNHIASWFILWYKFCFIFSWLHWSDPNYCMVLLWPSIRLQQFPRGLGKGSDAGVMGAWLETVLDAMHADLETFVPAPWSLKMNTWAYQIISVSLGISRSLNFNFQNCCTAPVFKH